MAINYKRFFYSAIRHSIHTRYTMIHVVSFNSLQIFAGPLFSQPEILLFFGERKITKHDTERKMKKMNYIVHEGKHSTRMCVNDAFRNAKKISKRTTFPQYTILLRERKSIRVSVVWLPWNRSDVPKRESLRQNHFALLLFLRLIVTYCNMCNKNF